MDQFLRLVENPRPQVIDEERLKFFISKISIWDHFSIQQSSYLAMDVDEKTTLLKKYYSDLDLKYFGKETDKSFFLFSDEFLVLCLCNVLLAFVCCFLGFYCLYILL